MIGKGIVLLRIENFEQRRGRITAKIHRHLVDLIEQEQRISDLTLLFITHNIAVVEYLSDETIVLKNGKVVEQGYTDDVCGNPQHSYTKELIAAVPRLKL